MSATFQEIETDLRKMIAYIGPRVTEQGERFVLADGPDGEAWAEIYTAWDEHSGWDMHYTTNLSEWVGVREIYDHFRRRDMTSWESQQIQASLVGITTHECGRLECQGMMASRCSVGGSELEGGRRCDFANLGEKLDRLLGMVEKQRRVKDWYSTAEVAGELQKAEFTVREWCRLGQCNAQKSKGYRGGKKQWMIPHEEKLRLENEGPAPHGTYRRPSPKY